MESVAQYFNAKPEQPGSMNLCFGVSNERADQFFTIMEEAEEKFEQQLDESGRENYPVSEFIAAMLAAVDEHWKPTGMGESFYAYFCMGNALEQIISMNENNDGEGTEPFDFNQWADEMSNKRGTTPRGPIATA